jgi:hypothetical protein
MRKALFSIWLAVFCLLGVTGFSTAGDDDEEGRRLRARLTGLQEVPAVSTEARGRFRAEIDDDGSSIEYELSYEDLEGTVAQAHIHLGQSGVNGGISVWLCQTPPTFVDPASLAPICPQEGTVTGTLTAANVIGPAAQGIAVGELAELIRAIRAGRTYANVHSSKFPGGEVRGQIR